MATIVPQNYRVFCVLPNMMYERKFKYGKTTRATVEEIKDAIIYAIDEWGTTETSNGPNATFVYYDEYYRFKKPNAANLEKLAQIVFKETRNTDA